MSPLSFMAAAIAVTLLALGSAAIAERALVGRPRVALRVVWMSATVVVLALCIRWAITPPPDASAGYALVDDALPRGPAVADAGVRVDPSWRERATALLVRARLLSAQLRVRAPSPAVDRVALLIWGVGSAGFALLLIVAARRLAAERRAWREATIAGQPVLVAPAFGPALVGLRAARIVVPTWVTELDETAQDAIIAHEIEHRRAGDHLALMAGIGVLVLMPWNVALWMVWRRLRLAIELDCDARVIARGVDRATYSQVLLTAWGRTRGGILPLPAFAERASGLGARVDHLLRPTPRGRSMRTIVGTLTAVALVAVACAIPRPDAITSVEGKTAPVVVLGPGGPPIVFVDSVERPDLLSLFGANNGASKASAEEMARRKAFGDSIDHVDVLKNEYAVRYIGERGRNGVALIWTKAYTATHPRIPEPAGVSPLGARAIDPSTPTSVIGEQYATRLLQGVALDAAARAEAVRVITEHLAAQRAFDGAPILASWPRIVAIEEERNAMVAKLIPTDAARAVFDANSAPNIARMKTYAPTVESFTSTEFDYLMRGITLPSNIATQAQAIVRMAALDDVALYERDPANRQARADRQARRNADLRALMVADADRASLDANLKQQGESLARLHR